MRNRQIDSRDSEQLEQRFRRLVGHLRRRAVLTAAARWLLPLQLVWTAFLVAWRLGWTQTSPFSAAVPGGLAAIFLGALAVAAWRSPRAPAAALLADRRLSTRELLTAAAETDPGDRHPLVRQVRRRAREALDPARIGTAFPLTRPAAWRSAFLGLAVLALALLVPAPAEVSAEVPVDPVVAETAEALAEELEKLADRLDSVDRPQTEDAFQRLEELVEELQSGEVATVEEALVELASFEESLSSMRQPAAADGLDGLIRDLAAEPMAAELAEAMTEGDAAALREALQGLAESLPASEAEAKQRRQSLDSLAQRFADLAAALDEEGRWAEAALLRQLAEAVRDGDFQRARELLGSSEMAGACQLGVGGGRGGSGGGGGDSDELGDEIRELAQLARHLLGSGRPRELARAGAPQDGARGRGNGPGPGTDSTHTEGEGYETGDSIVRHRQSGDTSDRTGEFEALYDSRLLDPEDTEDVRTSGEVGEAGAMLSREGRGAGVDGPASLPLRPLSSAAPGAPETATDLESVPLGYRHLVRGYFERAPAEPSPPPATPGDPP